MSGVPKSKRRQSSVEYVYNAQLLFHQTFEFALHLPKRWTFYLSERMVDHAEQVLHHAKSANSIYVSCTVDAQLRRLHLQQAYGHAQTLSSLVDEVYKLSPVKPVDDNGVLRPAITPGRYTDLIHCLDKQFELPKGSMRSDMRQWGSLRCFGLRRRVLHAALPLAARPCRCGAVRLSSQLSHP